MKKLFSAVCAAVLLLTGCGTAPVPTSQDHYRNYYEIFVRSFYDSNNDGVGDLNGITEKLDYLQGTTDSLGIDGIWLMPIMPSPTYHKYDVTDFYAIAPEYGTMADFERFIAACQARGIAVILDLVLNHTSTAHPWFVSAVQSLTQEPCGETVCAVEGGCRAHNPYCGYYHFTQEKRGGYHAIDTANGWYYEGVFWDQMPDLDLSNADVKQEILDIATFWLEKGVSGFRLDAVTQFFGENIEKNVAFLQWFADEMALYDAYLVGEAWTDAGSISQYYASGTHSFFNFPFSGATGVYVSAIRDASGFSLAEKIANWQQTLWAFHPEAIDAVFLSNHDNARSSGYVMRVPERQKMLASLYLLSPGNAFIYYGEEIGMTGSGKDENKRLPMVWSVKDKTGQAYPPPGADQPQGLTVGVDQQLKDKDSLLNHYRAVIRLKQNHPEIARGTVTALALGENGTVNETLCAFACVYEGQTVYVIHNLSDTHQTATFSKVDYHYAGISGSVSAGSKTASLKNDTLSLPPYSTVVVR